MSLSQGALAILAQTTAAAGATGAGVNVEFYNEVLATVNISAISGTGATLTVFIDAFDGTSWVQVAATAGLIATGVTAINLGGGSGSPFGQQIRARYTVTGTLPSVTFQVTGYGKG